MKLRLLVDIPVDAKHGLTRGKIVEQVEDERGGTWVIGDSGEKCKVFLCEVEEVKEDPIKDLIAQRETVRQQIGRYPDTVIFKAKKKARR